MDEREQLWEAEDQHARLSELAARDGEGKVAPLKRDVRSLGRLLGSVLREQAGGALFDAEEELRALTTAHREAESAEEREEAMEHAQA